MHDADHIMLLGKTVGVALVSGGAAMFAYLVAQTETMPQDGSLAVILATALISALASMIYLFREDKKRLHDLEMKKQETEVARLQIEAEKSRISAEDRRSREDALMKIVIKANDNLAQANAERQRLQDELVRLSRQLDPQSDSSKNHDTHTGKFINGGQ